MKMKPEMIKNKKKILFLVSEDWYFWTHRRFIAFEAIDKGFEVTLVARVSDYGNRIKEQGIKLIPSGMVRSSINPCLELKTFLELIRIYRQEKPDIVHHVALKPVIYGTWAVRLTGVKGIVNAFGGLGHLFSSDNQVTKLIKLIVVFIMRLTLDDKRVKVIVQNPNDLQQLINKKIAKKKQCRLIKGAGANLDIFKFSEEPDEIPKIMYAGRMLWSKGVGDFINAVKILRDQNIQFEAILLGKPDPENPKSISVRQIGDWEKEGLIEWKGFQEDMAMEISEVAIVVLPTYYGEGIPKILIETAAVGRPIIATNVPGCSEIVKQDWNGLLINPHAPKELADAIEILLSDKELRLKMGRNGRRLVENEFSNEIVLQQTFELYEEILR